MTLTMDMRSRILSLTDAHWAEHVRDESFAELIEGKEPGHRMADYVDDRTSSQGMYNPLNVKSGLQGMNGQPNVVSMQKLLDYLMRRWIDSYYLLIVKFDLSEGISHKTYLIDLLDWLHFVSYDAGPGQIMLREQGLFDELDARRTPPQQTIFDKVNQLFSLFESQVSSLISNRQQRLERQRQVLQRFQRTEFVVDQSALEFVP